MSSSPQEKANVQAKGNMALAVVKRSITVRKIAPRKTTAPSEHNKENKLRRSERECSQQKISTPGDDTRRGRSSSAKKRAVMPSPILPSTPSPTSPSQQPAAHPEDAAWSQKVRRSYSRLSDPSYNNRETLFGFERLKTPEVVRSVGQTKAGHSFSCLSGLNSFTSLLETEDCGSAFLPEPDTNIPGVAVTKERKRRRKVQQIGESELDAMAAKLNAEFEEAEVFELVVE